MQQMHHGFTIGTLARESDCKVETIRYYEQIGLMPVPDRSVGGQRRYHHRHLDRLRFIRHSRELGFPLDAIRELLSLTDSPDQSCQAVDAIAQTHLVAVEQRIARLQALKAELERMITQCRGGRIGQCHIIEVLADHTHTHCLHDNHQSPREDR